MTIPPNIGWEGVSITATGATQTRTFADRHGEGIVNAKQMGAEGDATTNDTVAIQAAIDAAFGDPDDMKVLYLPVGRYKITSTLYFHDVDGGLIVGDGQGATVIEAELGPPFVGSEITDDGETPILLLHNVKRTRFEGFDITGGPYYPETVAVYLFCSDGDNCDNNIFMEMSIGGVKVGFQLGGAGSDQLVRSSLQIRVLMAEISLTAVRTDSAASVNHSIIGGGSTDCGFPMVAGSRTETSSTYVPGTTIGNAAGNFAAVNGQISVLSAQSMGGSTVGIYNASKYPMSIVGMRDESKIQWQTGIVSTNSPASGGHAGPVFLCNYVLVGTTTYWALGDPVDFEGIAIIPLGRPRNSFIDCFNGGRVHSTGIISSMFCGNGEHGNMGKLDATSSIMIDHCGFDTNSYDIRRATGITEADPTDPDHELVLEFEGTGSVYLMGNSFKHNNTTGAWADWFLVGGFAGTFILTSRATTFAGLGVTKGVPPSSAAYAGARITILDGNVAVSGHFWDTVSSGGGANVLPLLCTGAAWRIA